MLVLTRRDGERFFVGDNVVITVVAAANGKCRIGIDAPREVNIRREELKGSYENPGKHHIPGRPAGLSGDHLDMGCPVQR
jgi:carbon storage regulator